MFAVVALVICGILSLLGAGFFILIGTSMPLGGTYFDSAAIAVGLAVQFFIGASLAQTWVSNAADTRELRELMKEQVRLMRRQAGEPDVTRAAGD